MTRQTRWNHTARFEAEVATKGDKTLLPELAQVFDLHTNQIRMELRGDGRGTRWAP